MGVPRPRMSVAATGSVPGSAQRCLAPLSSAGYDLGAWLRAAVPGTASKRQRGDCRQCSAAPRQLVQRDRPGHRDVQRLGVARLRDRRLHVAAREHLRRQPLPLRAEHEDDVAVEVELRQRRAAARDERDPPARPARRSRASGTRKSAPIDARSAFGPVGSAQPSESATPAPNAPPSGAACRRCPGRRHARARASPAARRAAGRRAGRRRSRAAGARASRPRPAAPRSTSSPGDEQLDRLDPGRRPRRDPHPPRRTARACRASAGRGACGRA